MHAVVSVPAEVSAHEAGCRYVDDRGPGIRRHKRGSGFYYTSAMGRPVHDPATLGRIRALAIPPAWTDVWICPSVYGHIQATGRDARGRKQYRYHARFREVRDDTKYGRLAAFGRALPKIRAALKRDLASPGYGRDKVLATVLRLLELTRIRIGHPEYARDNGSYGLATLRNRHVKVKAGEVKFRFRGKSGVEHEVTVADRRLAQIVRRCQDIPGEILFQYLDDAGKPQPVEAADVNEYLRRISGADFGTKDFRTWSGTVLAAQRLAKLERPVTKAAVARAIKEVAHALGNTASVCRKCYIHPRVLEDAHGGTLAEQLARKVPRRAGLSTVERAVLAMLEAKA